MRKSRAFWQRGRKMVSIKHIAAKCGVSIATVSKALNNHSDVSEDTRRLVYETAREMGYLPNAQARALKNSHTYNIGVLYSEKAGRGLAHNFFSSVLESFRIQTSAGGYDLTLICDRIGNKSSGLYEHCRYRSVDGLLILCADFYDPEVVRLMNSDIPLITIDFVTDKNPSVSSDNVSGMKKLVKHIIKKGHRKIAYIYGDSSQVTTIRLKTYLDTLKTYGIEPVSDYIKQGKYHDPVSVKALTDEMLRLYDPPTCIILPDDYASIGAFSAVREAGLSVPRDISLAGYDGNCFSQVLVPSLTTIKQDTALMGRAAAELLVRLIGKEKVSTASSPVIPGILIEGASVSERNASGR